jgi:hypothetical protein
MNTYKQLVLQMLLEGKPVTNLSVQHRTGCTRLSSVIYELRRQGHKIEMRYVQTTTLQGNPNRYGMYFLKDENGGTVIDVSPLEKNKNKTEQ